MGQINVSRDLIGEKISLRAQFELNWEGLNFKRLRTTIKKMLKFKVDIEV
jgi:hypothetical protein